MQLKHLSLTFFTGFSLFACSSSSLRLLVFSLSADMLTEPQDPSFLAAVPPFALLRHLHPAEHVDDCAHLLRLQLQALTWAARAKDAAIVSIRSKLLVAQTQYSDALAVNRRLETNFQEMREREERLQQQLADTRARLERVEIAEDRLATQIGDLEAESLEKVLADRRRIDSLEASLRDKEDIVKTMTERLQQLGAAHASPSSVETDLISQLERVTMRFQEVEEKLAEHERSQRLKDAALAQSRAEIQKLLEEAMVSDASRLKLEDTNKQLERLHKADLDKVFSVKVLDGSSVSFKLRTETQSETVRISTTRSLNC